MNVQSKRKGSLTALTSPTGLTVDITYDGSAIAPINAGIYAVTGTVSDLIDQGTTAQTLTVAKASQTITDFSLPANIAYTLPSALRLKQKFLFICLMPAINPVCHRSLIDQYKTTD